MQPKKPKAGASGKPRKENDFSFKRRNMPDYAAEELARALLEATKPLGFNELFKIVHPRIYDRYQEHVTEELLRLRIYEKLQTMTSRGLIQKTAKAYRSTPKLAEMYQNLPPLEPAKPDVPFPTKVVDKVFAAARDKGIDQPVIGSSADGRPVIVDSDTGRCYEVHIRLKEIQ